MRILPQPPRRICDADAIEQARRLAISDLVAKFDRSGLLAALAEIGDPDLAKAA